MKEPKIVWFTGQPGAGKTTLAKETIKYLLKCGISSILIDGDDLREITENLDFSENGRIKNIKLAQKLSEMIIRQGFYVVVSLVSPYREVREELKKRSKVLEVFVHTTEIRGKEKYFCNDYQPPVDNFIKIDTTNKSVQSCIDQLIEYL